MEVYIGPLAPKYDFCILYVTEIIGKYVYPHVFQRIKFFVYLTQKDALVYVYLHLTTTKFHSYIRTYIIHCNYILSNSVCSISVRYLCLKWKEKEQLQFMLNTNSSDKAIIVKQ